MRNFGKIVGLFFLVLLATPAIRADNAEEDAAKALTDVWRDAAIERDETLPHKPVVGVDLHWNIVLQNEHIRHLAAFKELRKLNLENTDIWDWGIAELA